MKVSASWPSALAGTWDATGSTYWRYSTQIRRVWHPSRARRRRPVRWLLRRGSATAAEVAEWAGSDESVARERLTASSPPETRSRPTVLPGRPTGHNLLAVADGS